MWKNSPADGVFLLLGRLLGTAHFSGQLVNPGVADLNLGVIPRLQVSDVVPRDVGLDGPHPVSYTHLTLPTNREV